MASDRKLREQIADIAQRPYNVRYEEIDKVLRLLGCAEPRRTKHGWIYKIPGGLPLMLNEHNNGKDKLPAYSVIDFRNRMMDLKLLE
jgi:hypothetical protein